MPETTQKPAVQLTGTDGNIFALLGRASKALKDAGQYAEAEVMTKAVFAAHSYDDALMIIMGYVDAS